MKFLRNMPITLKLLACFFICIFVLSAFHLFTYIKLLNTLEQEVKASANERMSNASLRLDESFSRVSNSYFSLTYTPSFRVASSSGNPTEYEMIDLNSKANLQFENDSISSFAIIFKHSSKVVSSSGNYTDNEFFSKVYSSEHYSAEYWQTEKQSVFAQKFYPAAEFSSKSLLSSPNAKLLLPVAFKPYWNNNIMVLLLLDIQAICRNTDQYLTEDFYIFDNENKLIYSSTPNPKLLTLPIQTSSLTETSDGSYMATKKSNSSGFTYVKILPKNSVVGQITNSLYLTLIIAFLALILGISIAIFSVWKLLHPVKAIINLFSNESTSPHKNINELHYIHESVDAILHQNEQFVQQLSKKDSALSGFLLQSQLKNIYVELDYQSADNVSEDRVFYIIYFRIHYRNNAFEYISAKPSAVAHMLLENMQQTLNMLFNTALIFQLEPTQFVAKLSLPVNEQGIDSQMHQLLHRLDNEREFAFFTVVQSDALNADSNFTAVYEQVLDASQYALVNNATQLLHLPIEPSAVSGFTLPTEQEQQLSALIRDGKSDEATELAQKIIERNLTWGIRRIHMVLLCSAIINATMRALSELHFDTSTINLNISSAYKKLSQCDTDKDYHIIVASFINKVSIHALQASRAQEPVLDGVHLFLVKNYQREFSMDELAEALHLSKSYLSTYYKSKTGTNLSDSIQFFRIQNSTELLADPKLRVGDIGEMVGISNINTFLRQFKKYTGMTPKEYRIRKLFMK